MKQGYLARFFFVGAVDLINVFTCFMLSQYQDKINLHPTLQAQFLNSKKKKGQLLTSSLTLIFTPFAYQITQSFANST